MCKKVISAEKGLKWIILPEKYIKGSIPDEKCLKVMIFVEKYKKANSPKYLTVREYL